MLIVTTSLVLVSYAEMVIEYLRPPCATGRLLVVITGATFATGDAVGVGATVGLGVGDMEGVGVGEIVGVGVATLSIVPVA